MTCKCTVFFARLSLAASMVVVAIAARAQGQDAPTAETQAQGRQAPTQAPAVPARYDDHQNMMDQLGITKLRPGRNGQRKTGEGFEEETANPYKDTMPEALTMKDGTKVTRADQWPARRAEIVEDFEREVYGRIPKDVPKVTWEVTGTTEGNSGGIPTITKTLVGHVDNSQYPQISVNIQASFTVPAGAMAPVPMLIEFGGFGGGFGPRRGGPGGAAGGPAAGGQQAAGGAPAAGVQGAAGAQAGPAAGPRGGGGFGFGGGGPSWQQQAIAHGWGYGNINPNSVQP